MSESPQFDGKPFDELTAPEIQIMAAIHLALTDRDMHAAVSLLHLLAVKDPNSAAVIVAAIKGGAS